MRSVVVPADRVGHHLDGGDGRGVHPAPSRPATTAVDAPTRRRRALIFEGSAAVVVSVAGWMVALASKPSATAPRRS